MADANMTDKWLSYADEDMGVAEHLLASCHSVSVRIICSYAQQASEKTIKAVIVSMTNDVQAVPRAHDLEYLLNLVKTMTKDDIDAKRYEDACVLTPYATLTRFPNKALPDNFDEDESYAQGAVAMAKAMVAWSKAVIRARSKSDSIADGVMNEPFPKNETKKDEPEARNWLAKSQGALDQSGAVWSEHLYSLAHSPTDDQSITPKPSGVKRPRKERTIDEAKIDLHEVYERLDGDAMKAAASAAARVGDDDEAAFWLGALNMWAQARDKKAEWRQVAEREIGLIKDKLVEALSPVKVYLFGSFADGRARDDSDYDFYVVVKNGSGNLLDLTVRAHEAVHPVQTRLVGVDIVIGTESGFKAESSLIGLEKQVKKKGVLLYG